MSRRYKLTGRRRMLVVYATVVLSLTGHIPHGKGDTKDRITNGFGMQFRLILEGDFMMGSRHSAENISKEFLGMEPSGGVFADEHPLHRVHISRSFYMQTTEVTQAQWFAVMQKRPWSGRSEAREADDAPVSYVSWSQAVQFCERLSEKENATYRLPTEAEWEYCCRAGSETIFSFGNSAEELTEYAWMNEKVPENVKEFPQDVGLKQPNSWGLHDMHGNVSEWCGDRYDPDYYSDCPAMDPQGSNVGNLRVIRGGAWNLRPYSMRSARRSAAAPEKRFRFLGFRIVRQND